jgi:hypothetical protein
LYGGFSQKIRTPEECDNKEQAQILASIIERSARLFDEAKKANQIILKAFLA